MDTLSYLRTASWWGNPHMCWNRVQNLILRPKHLLEAIGWPPAPNWRAIWAACFYVFQNIETFQKPPWGKKLENPLETIKECEQIERHPMFFDKESQHHRDLCYRWKCNPIKWSYRWGNAIQQKYHQSFCLFGSAKQVDDEVHVGEQTSKKKNQALKKKNLAF